MQSGIGGRQVLVLLLACAAVVGVLFAIDDTDDSGAQSLESADGTTTTQTTVAAEQPDMAETADPDELAEVAKNVERAADAAEQPKTLAVQAGADEGDASYGSTSEDDGTTTAAPTTTAVSGSTTVPGTPLEPTETTDPTETTAEAANSGSGTKPVIHLTFDDGPSELTPRVMDLLEQYGGRATFFVMGQAVEDHPDIAKEIVERGHAIANHSYDHMDWRQPGARDDIIRTQEIIVTATGVTPSCSRPPFGAQDDNLLSTLAALGLSNWRWDLSAEDHTMARYQVEQTLNTLDATPNIRGAEGKIVLQHDSDLLLGPSIDGLEAWLIKNADRYEFKVIDGCLDYQ